MTLKILLVACMLVGLAATNVATLLSSSFHDRLYAGLRKALLIGGEVFVDLATRRSPKRVNEEVVRTATKDLSDQNRALVENDKRLSAANDELNVRHAKLSAEVEGLQTENKKVKTAFTDLEARHTKTTADLDGLRAEYKKMSASFSDLEAKSVASKKSAKEMATSVNSRLAKGVARNTAAIPAESLPYIGIGVTLSVTALDIYDACQTMKDINGLLLLLGQGQENSDYCGTKLPTTKDVVDTLTKTWTTSMQSVTKEVKGLPASVPIPPIPEVRLPTAAEVKSVICPVIGGVSWLAC